ncbi:uncharacterized protein [Miscanthus floridulus]|uniref:uncharacterized protein n=1 Tax=Miscanthus floridulus TaxID=154761 RepID=UPI0034593E9B
MSFTARDSAERWRGGDEDGRRAVVGRWRGGDGSKGGNETGGDGDGVREDWHMATGAAGGAAAGVVVGGSGGQGASGAGALGGAWRPRWARRGGGAAAGVGRLGGARRAWRPWARRVGAAWLRHDGGRRAAGRGAAWWRRGGRAWRSAAAPLVRQRERKGSEAGYKGLPRRDAWHGRPAAP